MIFISHSSKDHDAASALHAKLLTRGYDPSQLFLDSDVDSGIAAGEPWQQVLYGRLKDCRALIVLCTQNWLDSKWCFAELIYAKASGKEILPIILEPCDFRGALDEHQAVLVHRDGDVAWERLWRALDTRHLGPRDDFGWPPKDGDACPFPGLLSFDDRLAGVYFGREPETHAVLEELRKMRANGEPRLLMITGASGSGKSSLLKAGVLPQLTHKSSGTEWLLLPVLRYGQSASPQHTVFDQLAMNVAGPDSDWKALSEAFTSAAGAKAFVDAVRDLAVARRSPGATVLLPVDQFEELLAPAAGPDAGAFLRFLLEVFGCANGRLLAIGTMRSDHLDVYERHPHALSVPYFYPWRLGPFPRDRVRDVIVKPAARAGVEVAPDLLARLEHDTPSSESLPLLAFTLEKLYRRYAADRKLELQEYEDLGGMEGAIQQAADAIALAPDVLEAVRLTFVKHLASVNDKDEVVRVTARWSEIPEAAKPVLEQFVAERLLVKNEHDDEGGRWVSLEVAHEALFRVWPALKNWLRDTADILRWRRDVQRDRAVDPKWSGLRPAQLAVARPWLRHRRSALANAEVLWIRRSIRRERMQRAVVAGVAAVVLGFGVYAWVQKRIADRESNVSLGRFLASQSMEVMNTSARNSSQSLLLAIEGYRRDPSATTASPLQTAMALTPVPVTRLKHDGPVGAVAFSPDGRWLATGDERGKVQVWDFKRHTQMAATSRRNHIAALFWRPDGQSVAAVLEAPPEQERDGPEELVFWNWRSKDTPTIVTLPESSRVLPTPVPERWLLRAAPENLQVWGMGTPISIPVGFVPRGSIDTTPVGSSIAATPGGNPLAIARGNQIDIVDAVTGDAIAKPFVLSDNERIWNLVFRPDGRALAITTLDGTTRVWDWQRNTILTMHRGVYAPSVLVFSPNGKLIAEIGSVGDNPRGSALRVWNASTGMNIYSLNSTEDLFSVRWARFTNDGRLVVSVGDSTLRVFSMTSDETVLPVFRFTPESTLQTLDLDPTGMFVAMGLDDGSVTVWRLEPGHSAYNFAGSAVVAPSGGAVALFGPSQDARIIDLQSRQTLLQLGSVEPFGVFSSDGLRFACDLPNGRILLADLRTRTMRRVPYMGVFDMEFSADGNQLFVARYDGRLTSIDAVSGEETRVLAEGQWRKTALSPKARFLARMATDRSIHIYDAAGTKALGKIASHKAFVKMLGFSPDGELLALNPTNDVLSLWSTKS